MRPKLAQIGCFHGLIKIHNDYQYIQTFCPIQGVFITNGVKKHLSSLFNPLTINDYSAKYSFETDKLKQAIIPPELFNQEYKFMSR